MEKVDSTPHAAAYVAAVLKEDGDSDASASDEDDQKYEEYGFRDPLYPNKHKKSAKKLRRKKKNK